MGTRAALAAGTVMSAAASGAWSYVASLAIGPAEPVHLDRNLLADYARLADAATGNGCELFAVTAAIFAACLLISGWRQQRNRARGGG